ncbi:hypothetical protein ABK040_015457 [Willaertia magna]
MSSNNKKRLTYTTQPFLISKKQKTTIEDIKKWTTKDILKMLKDEFNYNEIDTITLNGKHLYNAICEYRTHIKNQETFQAAKQSVINYLVKNNNKVVNENLFIETLANWLINEIIWENSENIVETEENISGEINVNEMIMFINKYIKQQSNNNVIINDEEKLQRSSKILVCSFGTNFEFIGRDKSIEAIMKVYEKQDLKINQNGIIDKSDVKLPFIAAAPGVGKSRLLKEIGLLLLTRAKLNINYFPLFVTFGNGCLFNKTEADKPLESLLLRMIYSMIKCFTDLDFDTLRTSFYMFVKKKILNMDTVLTAFKLILNNDNNKLGFYIAIDEVHLVDTNINEKHCNPLKQIISNIGQYIQYMPTHKTNILPLFAGTYHNVIAQNLAGSTYTPEYIPITALLPEDKIYIILDKLQLSNYDQLENWRTNTEFKHFLRLFGGFARGLEFYLSEYLCKERIVTERNAWESAFSILTKKYPTINSLYSKALLNYIITRKVVSKTDIPIPHTSITFSDLENQGYIMLNETIDEDKFVAVYPPVLLRNLIPTTFIKLYEELFFNHDREINGGNWEKIIHKYLYLSLSLLSDNEDDLTIEQLFPFAHISTDIASIKLQKIPTVEMMYATNQIHNSQPQKIKLKSNSGYETFEFDVALNNILDSKQKECFVVLNANSAKAGDILLLGLQKKHSTASILVFHIQCKWADSKSGTLSSLEINNELEKNRKLQFSNEKNETLEVHNITVIITGKSISDIPKESDLIVRYKKNFVDYFGVFASHMKFLHTPIFTY